jgi:signal peptidase I
VRNIGEIAAILCLNNLKRAMKRIKFGWKRLYKEIFYWTAVVVIAIALAISMRVFLFASFKIPTPSMEPAILPGDYILVNKQIPCPRVYPHFPKVQIDGITATINALFCRKLTNHWKN